MEETFKFLFVLRVTWERSWHKCNVQVSFLLIEPCYGKLYLVQVYTNQVWLLRVNFPDHRLVHEQACDPRLPSLWLFRFMCMEGRRERHWGGNGEWGFTTELKPQDLVMSKLTSKVPNLPGYEQMGQLEILIWQTFKRKYMKIIFLFTTSSILHLLEKANTQKHG